MHALNNSTQDAETERSLSVEERLYNIKTHTYKTKQQRKWTIGKMA